MPPLLKTLSRVMAPTDDLPAEAAEYLLSLAFSDEDQARYRSLAERHNNGELSGAELAELESFVHANTFLMLLQSKARLSLARHQPAA
jgi:hypothetical protein